MQEGSIMIPKDSTVPSDATQIGQSPETRRKQGPESPARPARIATKSKIERSVRIPAGSSESTESPPLTKKVSKGKIDFEAAPGSPNPTVKRHREGKARIEALAQLLENPERLSPDELYSRLTTFNEEMKTIPHLWDKPTIPSLFNNVSTPEKSRVSPEVHGNWLNDEKSFAGFMHPTLETRLAMLKALFTNEITRHVQLGNPFVIWLKHPGTGPVFPISSETFAQLQKEKSRTLSTEAGPITVSYGEIREDASGQKVGKFTISGTISGREVTRELEWPLDTLALGDDLQIELESSRDHDSYAFKDKSGKTLHTIEVGQIQWDDFQPTTILQLHEVATWLTEAPKASAACRAGVGRTGTIYVACRMKEWIKDHPGEALTKERLLSIIAEARLNRDPQIVQTKEQLALLVEYMNYLNNNPDLPFTESLKRLEHTPQAGRNTGHRVGKYFRDEHIAELLTKECKTVQEQQAREATLDTFFSDHACCPITGQNFVDPVITNTGYTYERSAILNWLKDPRHTCPMSRAQIYSLEPDLFMQRLMSVLYKRASETIPDTKEAKSAHEALKELLIDEPLHWCRVLSAVMPKNCYFIRKKSVGGANEFVIEFRGKDKVLKQSFHINEEGKFQPEGQSGHSFNTLEELVKALSESEEKKHVVGPTPPQRLTPEKIEELNSAMGKEAFLLNRFADSTLMTLIKHFEMRFEDSEEIGKKSAVSLAGYVRAGQLPASFPCFTYRKLERDGRESRYRLGIVNGQVCDVEFVNLQASSKEECLAKLKSDPKLSAEQIANAEEFIKIAKLPRKEKANYVARLEKSSKFSPEQKDAIIAELKKLESFSKKEKIDYIQNLIIGKLSPKQKAAYIEELEKIADQVEFPDVTLFIPTNKPVNKQELKLASIKEEQVVESISNGYVVR